MFPFEKRSIESKKSDDISKQKHVMKILHPILEGARISTKKYDEVASFRHLLGQHLTLFPYVYLFL